MTTPREIYENGREWTGRATFAVVVGMAIVAWLLVTGDLP